MPQVGEKINLTDFSELQNSITEIVDGSKEVETTTLYTVDNQVEDTEFSISPEDWAADEETYTGYYKYQYTFNSDDNLGVIYPKNGTDADNVAVAGIFIVPTSTTIDFYAKTQPSAAINFVIHHQAIKPVNVVNYAMREE